MLLDDRPIQERAFTVSQLVGRINGLLGGQPDLQDLEIRGEITNWTRSRPGHLYFSLKDERAQIRCTFFVNEARSLTFQPGDGMAVRVRGSAAVYEARGDLQVRVRRMVPDGVGALYQAMELARRKLEAEGLFRPERKRPLPSHPRVIGVVTSKEGAVLHDIRTTLARRNPAVQILLSASPVQGEGADRALVRALNALERRPEVECIVVARGGGSLEDLMAFNSEVLVRAVAGCRVPVVSAVGHETDVTLCDLAADHRAPTPTAAAEIVAPCRDDLLRHQQQCRDRMTRAMGRFVQGERAHLSRLQASPCLRFPLRRVEGEIQSLDGLTDALRRNLRRRLERERDALESLRRALVQQHPRTRARDGLEQVATLSGRLRRSLEARLRREREALGRLRSAAALREPERLTEARQERLQALRTSLERAVARLQDARRDRLQAIRDRLLGLSPLRVLERGYALVLDGNGHVVSSVAQTSPGARVQVRLRDGSLRTTVDEVEEAG